MAKWNVEPGPRLAVSVEEAAKMICVSRNTLHRYIKQGRVRTVRLGRRVIVPVKELERFLNGTETMVSAEKNRIGR